MTKIAIVPNAAGTGTFTIEAPNSNSNRTLVLPDAAGEIYGQGNILGTVSQSAGVPTGAIIERGSNANGEFVKYADGTLECWRYGEINLTITQLSSADFPVAFNHNFPVSTSWAYAQVDAVLDRTALFNSFLQYRQDNTWRFRCDGSGNLTSAQAAFSAIGRWY
jgi:hypothetical protein